MQLPPPWNVYIALWHWLCYLIKDCPLDLQAWLTNFQAWLAAFFILANSGRIYLGSPEAVDISIFYGPISYIAPALGCCFKNTTIELMEIETLDNKAQHLNPQPLDHKAWVLPLRYNSCPLLCSLLCQNSYSTKSLSLRVLHSSRMNRGWRQAPEHTYGLVI